MPPVLQLTLGAVTVDFVGAGTTPNGGTTRLETQAEMVVIPAPVSTFVTDGFGQDYARQIGWRRGSANARIAVPCRIVGQNADKAVQAYRDVIAIAERGGATLTISAGGTTSVVYDVLRSVPPSLPFDFGMVNLDGYADVVFEFECKPLGRASSTSSITPAVANFAGASLAGVRYATVTKATGDVPPATRWELAKSAAADDVSRLWMFAAEASSNPHLVFYNPGTGGGGTDFNALVGISTSTDANAISTDVNGLLTWTATTTSEENIGFWGPITAHAPRYFRVLIVAKQNGGTIGDIVLRVGSATVQNGTSVILYSASKAPTVVGSYTVLDLGVIQAPIALNATYRLYVFGTRLTGSASLTFDAFVLAALPATGTNVYDLSGGECFASYGSALSTATFAGPFRLDGLADPRAAYVYQAANEPQPMQLAGEPPRLAAGAHANSQHLLVVSTSSTAVFTKTKGLAASGHSAVHYPSYVTLGG